MGGGNYMGIRKAKNCHIKGNNQIHLFKYSLRQKTYTVAYTSSTETGILFQSLV